MCVLWWPNERAWIRADRAIEEAKFVKGFQTGDLVKACVTSGKKVGTYVGRVAIRTTGYFNITTAHGTIQGINFKYCQAIHRMDGYSYSRGGAASPVA